MDYMFLFIKVGYFRLKYDKNCSASFIQPLVWGACEPEACVLPAEVLVPQAAVLRRSGPDQHASQERQNPKNRLQKPAAIRFLPK